LREGEQHLPRFFFSRSGDSRRQKEIKVIIIKTRSRRFKKRKRKGGGGGVRDGPLPSFYSQIALSLFPVLKPCSRPLSARPDRRKRRKDVIQKKKALFLKKKL
jgi:hypothetical protein